MSRAKKESSVSIWLRNNWLLSFVFGLFILLSFTPLRILSFLFLLYTGGRLLPFRLSVVANTILTFLLWSSALCVIAALAWLIKLPLSSGLIISVSIVAIYICWLYKRPRLMPKKGTWIEASDTYAIAVAIVFGTILMWPIKANPSFGTLSATIMAGGDNSAHIEMLKVNDLNGGFSIADGNRVNMPPANITYPQGWHLNGAFAKWVTESILPIGNSPVRILAFYYAFSALWFCIFVFMIVRLSTYLYAAAQTRASKLSALFVSLAAGAGTIVWLLPLFEYGFQTQIGALVLLLAEILVLAEGYKVPTPARYKYFLAALLLVSASTFFWSFLLPVAGLIAGLCVMQTILNNRKWPSRLYLIGFLLVGAAVLFQPFIQSRFAINTGSDVPIVNMNGNVAHSSMALLLLGFIGVSLLFYYQIKSVVFRIFYMATSIALLFSLALMKYQLSTIQELRYYYFKANYTIIMLAVVMLAVAFGLIVQNLLKRAPINNRKVHTVIITLLASLITLSVVYALRPLSVTSFLNGRLSGVRPDQAGAIATVMNGNVEAGLSLITIGSCNRGDDIRAAQLAHTMIYSSKTQDPSAYGYAYPAMLNLEQTQLFSNLQDYVRYYGTLTVISGDQVVSNNFREYLGDLKSKVTFIELDQTPETESVSQCPDRTRVLTNEEKARGLR